MPKWMIFVEVAKDVRRDGSGESLPEAVKALRGQLEDMKEKADSRVEEASVVMRELEVDLKAAMAELVSDEQLAAAIVQEKP